ncbi:hypothetical protein QR680_001280 [Steinernema hermaphroditum]|uniref:Acyl-CoA thioesterase-like N-terminal HotDog domain-containing protein n=1 Tax=Steinernema hermaphroditum TaxID=289476 RepID=A0AA39GYH3_9BILA|nr:hypothetical protein QR680_001280 [Steinernema hermaphroditum]
MSAVFSPIRLGRNRVRFNAPHLGGAKVSRVFGGQIASQIVQAVKLVNHNCLVLTVKVNFVAPGHTAQPIEVHVEMIPESDFAVAHVFQEERQIATSKIRFGDANDLLSESVYSMNGVKSPLSHEPHEKHLKTIEEHHPWQFLNLLVKNGFFEIRPVDIRHITSQPMDRKALQVWCKIGKVYRNDEEVANIDGVSIVIMISDYLVAVAAHINLLTYHQEHEFGIGASLNHMVTFHELNDVDPMGWYLYNSSCEIHSNNRYMIDAQIFDGSPPKSAILAIHHLSFELV